MADPLVLTVWFDGECPLCTRIAGWLGRQPQFVPLRCVAAQRAGASGCPLDASQLLAQLTVTASDGAVYRGTNAWLTVLWALRRHRALALRLAQPRWRPLAERAFATIAGVASWTKRRQRR